MPTTDHDRLQEALGPPECLRLLAKAGIGRLAFTQRALPVIQPVCYWLRDEDVLIPARYGSPLVDAVRASVVALEADDYDEGTRTGWAVTVVGHAEVHDGDHVDVFPPSSCLIAVRVGLLLGWRTSLPM